jgi:5-formyltetrahydrofolate cyclo-ligase
VGAPGGSRGRRVTPTGARDRRSPASKAAIRRRIWSLLARRRVARFPAPIVDRIPNFVGAEAAAARLAALPEWRAARRIKCNPDAPQRPVRLRALQDGKEVFMAVPRLTEPRCFLRLRPRRLRGRLAEAATIRGAAALGEPVRPRALGHVDLVVAGSVAVTRGGARVGKGGGYSDLEFALLGELGLVDDATVVATTVHDLQMVTAIPMTAHDVPVDIVVTPTRVVRTNRTGPRPRRIDWRALSPAQISAMPVLAALRRRR